ncbi:uncharacterized protein A4U43_C02F19510 [Asparagus officinalis]|uniref:Uncharacterized protein n=1 Tax=Asparagus officinalis TaxID=4686 RepID=A0A5P1FM79_ASPOF|nr:uncharacterized protein A4U43_C02F19510 [Asparagus officinalis]
MEKDVVGIVLRYNGYWRNIPRTSRKKYECGNQRTLKVDANNTSLNNLAELIYGFLPVVKGNIMKLSYKIIGTNPRRFARIKTDGVFMGVIENHLNKKKLEMFLTIESVPSISWRIPVTYKRRNPPREHVHKSTKTVHIDMDALSSDEGENYGVSDGRFVNMATIEDDLDRDTVEDNFDWGISDDEVDGIS